MDSLKGISALTLWQQALCATVQSDAPDLTARQLAILLHVYLLPPPHTVRGLAAALHLSKPVVTRALDRLATLGLARRRKDEADKRNVLIQRTVAGSVFLSDLAARIEAAGIALEQKELTS